MVALLIVLGIVFLLALYCISMYNRLVAFRNNRENAYANVDVQLKQRHDLIPQLGATAKGYAAHEKSVFEEVTKARSAAMNATTVNDKVVAENQLSSALAGMRITLEAYPQLQADKHFSKLQDEISDVENKLAASRRFFNSATKELNTAVQSFPSNILANMFGFHKEPMIEIPQEDRKKFDEAPNIQF